MLLVVDSGKLRIPSEKYVNQDFSAMLLENGYARVYTESKINRTDSYLILEENAKKNKLGLWGCPTLPVNID